MHEMELSIEERIEKIEKDINEMKETIKFLPNGNHIFQITKRLDDIEDIIFTPEFKDLVKEQKTKAKDLTQATNEEKIEALENILKTKGFITAKEAKHAIGYRNVQGAHRFLNSLVERQILLKDKSRNKNVYILNKQFQKEDE